MQSYTIRFFFFLSSWIRKKFECKRNLAGLVWWEIKNVLHVRVHTCKYAISGLKMVRFDFFLVLLLSPLSSWFQVFVPGFISGFNHCILLTPNFMIEVMKLILGKHFTNNSTNMPKLSKRQLHSRKNFLSLQKHLDDNGRYRRPIVLYDVRIVSRHSQIKQTMVRL